MDTIAEKCWWTDFFDDRYATIGLVPDSESAEKARSATIDFLVRTLELSPGHIVLDQCCGIGRLSLPLARKGIGVIGVDQAPTYAKRAQETSDAEGLGATFHQGDAFDFVAPKPCDAAYNWFTSFGYHADDSTNRRMLDRAFESLKPGGLFALDYISIPRVLREYRTCHLERFAYDGDELWLIQEPEFDFAAGMIRSSWTFMRLDKSHEVRRIENRAYMPGDLVSLMKLSGFADIKLFGAVDGEPFDRFSRRCIVVGRKPRRNRMPSTLE